MALRAAGLGTQEPAESHVLRHVCSVTGLACPSARWPRLQILILAETGGAGGASLRQPALGRVVITGSWAGRW